MNKNIPKNRLCQICEDKEATGPKMVGSVTSIGSNSTFKTLLMCEGCHDKYKKGEITLHEVKE